MKLLKTRFLGFFFVLMVFGNTSWAAAAPPPLSPKVTNWAAVAPYLPSPKVTKKQLETDFNQYSETRIALRRECCRQLCEKMDLQARSSYFWFEPIRSIPDMFWRSLYYFEKKNSALSKKGDSFVRRFLVGLPYQWDDEYNIPDWNSIELILQSSFFQQLALPEEPEESIQFVDLLAHQIDADYAIKRELYSSWDIHNVCSECLNAFVNGYELEDLIDVLMVFFKKKHPEFFLRTFSVEMSKDNGRWQEAQKAAQEKLADFFTNMRYFFSRLEIEWRGEHNEAGQTIIKATAMRHEAQATNRTFQAAFLKRLIKEWQDCVRYATPYQNGFSQYLSNCFFFGWFVKDSSDYVYECLCLFQEEFAIPQEDFDAFISFLNQHILPSPITDFTKVARQVERALLEQRCAITKQQMPNLRHHVFVWATIVTAWMWSKLIQKFQDLEGQTFQETWQRNPKTAEEILETGFYITIGWLGAMFVCCSPPRA